MSGLFYKGVPIEELTRVELEEAIEELSEIIEKMHKDNIKALEALCGV